MQGAVLAKPADSQPCPHSRQNNSWELCVSVAVQGIFPFWSCAAVCSGARLCGCFGQFVYFPIFLFIKSAFCALCWERTPIQSGLCNEFCCCIKNYILGRPIKNTTNMIESCLWFELWVRTVLEMNHLTVWMVLQSLLEGMERIQRQKYSSLSKNI